nr:DciA family protein [Solimonas marina]
MSWLPQVRQLADINRALPSWCAEPWVRHLRVANVRRQTVVVYSASAAALIPLRHRSKDLLHWLNDHYRLSCTRIETKVRPPLVV